MLCEDGMYCVNVWTLLSPYVVEGSPRPALPTPSHLQLSSGFSGLPSTTPLNAPPEGQHCQMLPLGVVLLFPQPGTGCRQS